MSWVIYVIVYVIIGAFVAAIMALIKGIEIDEMEYMDEDDILLLILATIFWPITILVAGWWYIMKFGVKALNKEDEK